MDYGAIEAFLVGHCGMSSRQAAFVSVREFEQRTKAYKERKQGEWEMARWTAFSIFAPFVKNGPKTPEQWVRFPWEKEKKAIIVTIDSEKEDLLNKIYKDFITRKELTS